MNYFRCGGGRSTHTATKINVAKTPLATFESNVSGLYIPEILAYFSATQSGTGDPSPINPRAINGVSSVDTTVCGVNIWDEQWEVGGISSSTGQNSTATNRIRSKNYIRVSPQTQYYFKASNSFRVFYYTATKEFIDATNTVAGNYLFTTPDGVHYMRFILVTDTFAQNDVSINYPATDTAYHAYTGTTATTALGGTYYGCYLNVPTGLLTVVKGIEDMGDISWTYNSDNGVFYSGRNTEIKINDTDAICSSYLFDGSKNASRLATIAESLNNYEMAMFSIEGQQGNIVVKDTNYTDPTAFATATTGQKIVYTLATPIEIQLTPAQVEQLLGQNNVFCSSGDVAVKFWKVD